MRKYSDRVKVHFEILVDLNVPRPSEYLKSGFWNAACMSVRLVAPERLGTFYSHSVVKEFIHHRSVPGEYEHVSKIGTLKISLKGGGGFYSKMAPTILIKCQ
jgi:hypothetical protein